MPATHQPSKPPGQPYDHDLPTGHPSPRVSPRACLTVVMATLAASLVGCVATRPAVSAKASVTVKEVSAHVSKGGRDLGRGSGNETGELAANVSFELNWGAK